MESFRRYVNKMISEIADIKYGIREVLYEDDYMFHRLEKIRGVYEFSGFYMEILNSADRGVYADLIDMVFYEILDIE